MSRIKIKNKCIHVKDIDTFKEENMKDNKILNFGCTGQTNEQQGTCPVMGLNGCS